MAARASASRPTSRRAASICRISASSSMPTCRTIRRCCSIAPAAPAAPAARASASCWCRRRAAGAPKCCSSRPASTRSGAPPPQADEIRKLDQQRMLQDALFTEEPTEDDLTLARALLAERSPEDIAAALARLYRARLPSPEDILDPGQEHRAARPRGSRPESATAARRAATIAAPGRDRRPSKPRARDGMAGGQRLVSRLASAARKMPKRAGCCR